MTKIGVGVEGPSDQRFWRRYLHRVFPGIRFDVRSLKSRSKLIAATPRLLDSFRSARYAGGIIIMDRDDDPCFHYLLDLFHDNARRAFNEPVAHRQFQLCVAVREIESWFLADATAIRALLEDPAYTPLSDTSGVGHGMLRKMWKQKHGANAPFNKIFIAEEIAGHFDHQRAQTHSSSLRTAWPRIEALARREM